MRIAGKDDNKKWILKTLNRLSANTVTLEDERYTYSSSSIEGDFFRQGHCCPMKITPKLTLIG